QTCVQGALIDAAPDGPTCAGTFCDGFESGDTSRWTSVSVTPTATLGVESAMGHSGSFALDCTVPAIGNGSIAAVVDGFTLVSTGLLAVRAWLYLPQPLIHFDSVITLFGAGTPNHIMTLDADDTQHWTATESGTAGIDHQSTAVAAENTWTC